MDKVEKIARILAKYLYGDVAEWEDLTPDGKVLMLYKAGEILKAISKPKEKPPLLSDEQILTIKSKLDHRTTNPFYDGEKAEDRAIAKAQWDICVKHYEGD